jgi:quinol monooxygenase YgiN
MMLVLGMVEVHPDDVHAATALGAAAARKSIREPGCMHYMFSRDRTQPNRFLVVECWTSPDSLAAHMESEHAVVFRDALRGLRIKKLHIRSIQVASPTEVSAIQPFAT